MNTMLSLFTKEELISLVIQYSKALDENSKALDEKQAKIDSLMFEYCPEDMDDEQIERYTQSLFAVG